MKTILLISPYWKEPHRWMVSSVKLAELWQRLGYNVVVICMGSETKTEKISDTLTVHSRKDFFLRDPLNFGICPGFGRYARRIARDLRPDHIVINKILFWSSWSIIGLRLSGHKVLVLTDALVGMTWWPRGLLPKIIMGIGGWTMGWLTLLLAHRIVTFHPQPPLLLKRLGIASKVRVIPTGIDTAPFALTPSPSPSSRMPAGRGVQPFTQVTYVGRLESVKGVDDLLEAAVPLKESYPALNIQVVGWHRPDHPLVARFGNRVTFTGLRDDIPAILAATHIFVLPSHSEGLSNALMEAMASGCACIASDAGGNRFLIQNGVSGFLFPPGDREALAAHIRRLIEDPAKRRALGEAARKRIEEQFSWKIVGEQYQKLFLFEEHR